jgi:sugar (pentulose or hexulose) kinase
MHNLNPTAIAPGVALGIDFGTSGARAIAINTDRQIQAQVSVKFADNVQPGLANLWQTTLDHLLSQLPESIRQATQAIAINGTSGTVLLCDAQGIPVTEPILYHDARGTSMLEAIRAIAPPNHTVISATSSLAKLLWWADQAAFLNQQTPLYFLHQADWLSFLLHGQLGITDYHNALKLGYDVGTLEYPQWLKAISHPFVLPTVMTPGAAIAPVTSAIANQFEFPHDCQVCAGTTDSIAAFLASGAETPGEAVTSLGSTLVLKLLSKTRVDDGQSGIYSHRLGNLWLVGGASNTGGAVLQQFFSQDELDSLSPQIDPEQPSPLDYYPLLKPGERFPINDPTLAPRLQPRPANPVDFLHGLLDSMAGIEAQGYHLLTERGASPLLHVYSSGGGANNATWMRMRSRHLQVPVLRSAQTEAAYGTALLAWRSQHDM